MKAIILLLFISFSLVVSALLLSFAPYHFYSTALNSGLKSRFFEIDTTPKYLHEGSYYSLNKMEGLSSESKKLWESFHFSNFILPLPVRHPVIELVPIIEKRRKGPILGAKLNLRNKSTIAEFRVLESYKFDRKTKHHKIFELPFFKNYLLSKDSKTLWKDMFTKNLMLPEGSKYSVNYYQKLWGISYRELVYNLYLLQFRKEFLPENARSIAYYTNKGFGVVELIDVDKEAIGLEGLFRTEMLYVYDKGFIHKFEFSSKYEDIISESIRKKFIQSLTYKPSDESSSIEIYSRYKNLSYRQRITQEGLTFLFAAWSHVTENKEYLKEMIQFLERGKMKFEVLSPLYDYSFKMFGTNFSILKDNLKESASEQLKRKIIEEEKNELKSIEEDKSSDYEGDFQNEDDKVKFYLQKAKEQDAEEDSNTIYKD